MRGMELEEKLIELLNEVDPDWRLEFDDIFDACTFYDVAYNYVNLVEESYKDLDFGE
tara:strand:+ start:925 stop:1095 length:171 start_codon:yes stop_codon:yes gene_type:complete